MPRYDYVCPECGAMECDVEQTLAQVEAGEAPVCWDGCCNDVCRCSGSCTCPDMRVKMVRVIGPVGFSLKGGGWAADGYSSKPKV